MIANDWRGQAARYMALFSRLAGVAELTNIPLEKARSMASEVDRLIGLADTYNDFLLGALLCTVRDHLALTTDEGNPPST